MVIENSSLLSITDVASQKFREVLDEQDAGDAMIRISLAPGENGGVEYVLGLEDSPAENDTVIPSGPVKVVVDSESSPLLEGSSIDYVEGLQRSGFVISNPNFPATGGCGCGGGGCGCGGSGAGAEHGEADPVDESQQGHGGCACGGH
ncbi:MAG: HesB/IscA family protein [Chloroflexota bacterium]